MKYLIILLSFFMLACGDVQTGEDGANGEDGESYTPVLYSLSGNVQHGPCWKNGAVIIQPLDLVLEQVGTHYMGFTKDFFGTYIVPAEIPELHAEVFFEGECHNEITGGSNMQKLSGIINVTDAASNINPLTMMRSTVARWLFNDPGSTAYQNIDSSLTEAESLILSYLGMPPLTQRFTEMNLEQAGIHDAVLALINSMILYGRTEAEQGDYIVAIANGVIINDLALKAEIAATIDLLPLITIKNNLESRYAELGLLMEVPPIWHLGAPEYYADLLERIPVITTTFNLDDNTNCNFDTGGYNTFAIPHIFTSGIETSKYIALNFTGDISIWTRAFDTYDRPGVKLLDIAQLKEVLLNDPVKLPYNGLLGEHSLTPGEYYIVIKRDADFMLNTSCEGDLLPFGRKLATADDGLNWIGHDNITPWFRKSGVKMYATD